MKNVFDINSLINNIINRFANNSHSFRSDIEINSIGFQYKQSNVFKNVNIFIRWSKNISIPFYSSERNIICIPIIKTIQYDESIDSILNIIEYTRDSLVHEISHWLDFNKYNLNPRTYTRISQIENPELLSRIDKLNKSIQGLVGDEYNIKVKELDDITLNDAEYNNSQTELNAHILELIHYIIELYLESISDYDGITDLSIRNKLINTKNDISSYNAMLQKMKNVINFDNLTNDSKKRIYKRLYVFQKALNSIDPVIAASSDSLKHELIKYFDSDKIIMHNNNTKLESISYNHQDIIHNKDVAYFEANYCLDDEYKMWFDNKYIKPNACLSESIIRSLNRIYSDNKNVPSEIEPLFDR